MFFKLLVKTPEGEQKIIEIEKTGNYFDQTCIIWDERLHGKLPEKVPTNAQRFWEDILVKDNNGKQIYEKIAVGENKTEYQKIAKRKQQWNLRTRK